MGDVKGDGAALVEVDDRPADGGVTAIDGIGLEKVKAYLMIDNHFCDGSCCFGTLNMKASMIR